MVTVVIDNNKKIYVDGTQVLLLMLLQSLILEELEGPFLIQLVPQQMPSLVLPTDSDSTSLYTLNKEKTCLYAPNRMALQILLTRIDITKPNNQMIEELFITNPAMFRRWYK